MLVSPASGRGSAASAWLHFNPIGPRFGPPYALPISDAKIIADLRADGAARQFVKLCRLSVRP
ncbi:hypothetical protein ACVJGD_002405 [Bradyrhizobium sp. USDA 10063]